MAASCDSYFQGEIVRLTRLDSCGAPVAGACSTSISESFVKVEIEPDEADGTEIEVTKANGKRCYYRKGPKKLNGFTANIEFCDVDPELFNIASATTLVLDDQASPVAQGFAVDDTTYSSAHFALELWTNLASGGCADPSGRQWGYLLLPWLTNGTVSTPTFEDGSADFTVNEAMTRSGNQWGVGPYDIQNTDAGAPAPLFSALSPTAHLLVYKVNIAPPASVCGCQELIVPT